MSEYDMNDIISIALQEGTSVIKLDLDAAQAIVAAALQMARQQNYSPIVVVVLDSRGLPKCYAAEDGTSLGRFDVAMGKAHGALAMGVGSRSLRKLGKENPAFVNSLVEVIRGGLVPNPGGVLIRDQRGDIIGAVGISGDLGDKDEAAAIAGITVAGFSPDPGTD